MGWSVLEMCLGIISCVDDVCIVSNILDDVQGLLFCLDEV